MPQVDRQAFTSYGELAFISKGALWMLDGATRQLRLVATAAAQPVGPAFSPNGRWLSYGSSTGVWIAGSDGSAPRRVAGPAGGDWLPDGRLLAGGQIWRVSATGTLTRTGTEPTGLAAWSEDGERYAFVFDSLVFSMTKPSRGIDRLEVASSLTSTRRTWYASKVSFTKQTGAQGNFVDRVDVLPGRQGLLFTLDPYMSASIAADGLDLYELRTPGGRATRLGITVADAVANGPAGMFAFTNGPNRYAWLTKTVETCKAATGRCTPVRTRAGALSFDPAWSKNGTLAFVEAPPSSSPSFFQSTLEAWYATHRLWLLAPGSRSPEEVAGTAGASAPEFASNGESLMYVSNDALWLLPRLATKPERIASPLFDPTSWPSYYGQVDWSGQFAWSASKRA